MDGVTLLESGTTRHHFALIKRLESAEDAVEADRIVREAANQAKHALSGKSSTALTEAATCSQLLVVLHCCNTYPHVAASSNPALYCSFALVPALTLLSVAKHARGLQIAYLMIEALLGRTASYITNEVQASSLLLFNTMRLHLGSSASAIRQTRSSHVGSSLQTARTYMALRSIVSGVPRGAETIPAFHGPVSSLLTHKDHAIRALAVRAILVLQSYREEEEDKGLDRAVWEDVRRACKSANESKEKVKSASSAMQDHECLMRALFYATKNAYSHGILNADEFIRSILDSCPPEQSSKWCHLRAMQVIRQARLTPTNAALIETCQWISACMRQSSYHYPLLLESSRFIGQHAQTLLTDPQSLSLLQDVWSQCISHLQAHNANRKLLALQMLHAMLPCGWTEVNAALQLSEDDMTRVLENLSDYDATIRMQTLKLLAEVDSGLLAAHLQALKQKAGSSAAEGRIVEDTTLHAVEVMVVLAHTEGSDQGVRWGDLAKEIVEFLQRNSNLRTSMQPAIDKILSTILRSDDMNDRTTAVFEMTARLHDAPGEELNATGTMLMVTLVCEVLRQGSNPETRGYHAEMLKNMSATLTRLTRQAALQEAWIVAMIKLAAFCAQTTVQSTLSYLTAFSKTCESQSVKHRLQQYTYMATEERTEQLATRLLPLSLLDTLDIIDEVMEQFVNGAKAQEQATRPTSAKPLRYEEYDSPIALSSSSPSRKLPFRAKPRPSSIRSQMLSESLVRDDVEAEMQQSIAHLTLQNPSPEHVPSLI